MSFHKIGSISLMIISLMLTACGNDAPTPQPQPEPVVNRLIFTGTVTTGGYVKIELNDAALESVLDGNPNYNNGGLSGTPPLPLHSSMINVSITNLNYYGNIVTLNCVATSSNKIPLELRSNAGSLYENTDGVLYVYDPVLDQYLEQLTDETINDAVIPVINGYHFYTDCNGDDNSAYRVSFYHSADPLSHGIATTMSILNGTVEGIIRVHRIGDGYHPYMDILL